MTRDWQKTVGTGTYWNGEAMTGRDVKECAWMYTYRDVQGQTGTARDRQEQVGTNKYWKGDASEGKTTFSLHFRVNIFTIQFMPMFGPFYHVNLVQILLNGRSIFFLIRTSWQVFSFSSKL